MEYSGTVQPQFGTSLCSLHLDTKALWSRHFVESLQQFLQTAWQTQYQSYCTEQIESYPYLQLYQKLVFSIPFQFFFVLFSCSFQTLNSKTNLKSSSLAYTKRSLKLYNPLLHFISFLIGKRWKHLTSAIFAVLFLVLAALGTLTVDQDSFHQQMHPFIKHIKC